MDFEIVPVTRFQQNCSILWCEKTNRAAVIDPGGDLADILGFLDIMDLEPEVALVTHGHFDHCGAAAQFAEITGARIEGPHRSDAQLVRQLPKQSAFFIGLAEASKAGADASNQFNARIEDYSPLPGNSARCYLPSRWLEHGDRISFGEETLDVIHCPGHTSGHVAYFSASRRQAFVGDILFRRAIGAWEHPDGNLPLLLHSIRSRLFTLGDDVKFVPGHGEASTFAQERRDNPFVGDEAFAKWSKRHPHTPDTATL